MGWFDFGSSSDTSSSTPSPLTIISEINDTITPHFDPIAEVRNALPKGSDERKQINNLLGWGLGDINSGVGYPDPQGGKEELEWRIGKVKGLITNLPLSNEQKGVLNNLIGTYNAGISRIINELGEAVSTQPVEKTADTDSPKMNDTQDDLDEARSTINDTTGKDPEDIADNADTVANEEAELEQLETKKDLETDQTKKDEIQAEIDEKSEKKTSLFSLGSFSEKIKGATGLDLGDVSKSVGGAIKKFTSGKKGVGSLIGKATGKIGDMLGPVSGIAKSIGGILGGKGGGDCKGIDFSGIGDTISGVLGSANKFLSGGVGGLMDSFSGKSFGGIGNIASKVMSGIGGVLNDPLGSIKKVGGLISSGVSGGGGFLSGGLNKIGSLVSGGVGDLIGKGFSSVKSAISGTGSAIGGFLKDPGSALGSIFDGVGDMMKGIPKMLGLCGAKAARCTSSNLAPVMAQLGKPGLFAGAKLGKPCSKSLLGMAKDLFKGFKKGNGFLNLVEKFTNGGLIGMAKGVIGKLKGLKDIGKKVKKFFKGNKLLAVAGIAGALGLATTGVGKKLFNTITGGKGFSLKDLKDKFSSFKKGIGKFKKGFDKIKGFFKKDSKAKQLLDKMTKPTQGDITSPNKQAAVEQYKEYGSELKLQNQLLQKELIDNKEQYIEEIGQEKYDELLEQTKKLDKKFEKKRDESLEMEYLVDDTKQEERIQKALKETMSVSTEVSTIPNEEEIKKITKDQLGAALNNLGSITDASSKLDAFFGSIDDAELSGDEIAQLATILEAGGDPAIMVEEILEVLNTPKINEDEKEVISTLLDSLVNLEDFDVAFEAVLENSTLTPDEIDQILSSGSEQDAIDIINNSELSQEEKDVLIQLVGSKFSGEDIKTAVSNILSNSGLSTEELTPMLDALNSNSSYQEIADNVLGDIDNIEERENATEMAMLIGNLFDPTTADIDPNDITKLDNFVEQSQKIQLATKSINNAFVNGAPFTDVYDKLNDFFGPGKWDSINLSNDELLAIADVIENSVGGGDTASQIIDILRNSSDPDVVANAEDIALLIGNQLDPTVTVPESGTINDLQTQVNKIRTKELAKEQISALLQNPITGSYDKLKDAFSDGAWGEIQLTPEQLLGISNILESGLSPEEITKELIDYLSNAGIENPEGATKLIAAILDPNVIVLNPNEIAEITEAIINNGNLTKAFGNVKDSKIKGNFEEIADQISDVNPNNPNSTISKIDRLFDLEVAVNSAIENAEAIKEEYEQNEKERIEDEKALAKILASTERELITEGELEITEGFDLNLSSIRKELTSEERRERRDLLIDTLDGIINYIDVVKGEFLPNGIRDTDDRKVREYRFIDNCQRILINIKTFDMANVILRSSFKVIDAQNEIIKLLGFYDDWLNYPEFYAALILLQEELQLLYNNMENYKNELSLL